MVGRLRSGVLDLREIHRFPNEPVQDESSLRWHLPQLWSEMRKGLERAVSDDVAVESIGVDTWGCDYGLLDTRGDLVGNILPPLVESGTVLGALKASACVALAGTPVVLPAWLDTLEELTGVSITGIQIIGGGSRNRLLNQFTADATGRPSPCRWWRLEPWDRSRRRVR